MSEVADKSALQQVLDLHQGDRAAAFLAVVAQSTCTQCNRFKGHGCLQPNGDPQPQPHLPRLRRYLADQPRERA